MLHSNPEHSQGQQLTSEANVLPNEILMAIIKNVVDERSLNDLLQIMSVSKLYRSIVLDCINHKNIKQFLGLAAEAGKLNFVKELVIKLELFIPDRKERKRILRSLLIAAIENGHAGTAEFLFKKIGDRHLSEQLFDVHLLNAYKNKNQQLRNFLITNIESFVIYSLLEKAVKDGNKDYATFIYQGVVAANYQIDLAITKAAFNQNLNMVKFYFAMKRELPPLISSAINEIFASKNPDFIEFILQHAPRNDEFNKSLTIDHLRIAVECKMKNIAEGGNIDKDNKWNNIIKEFYERKPENINKPILKHQSLGFITPLQFAILSKAPTLAKSLIKHGADVNATTNDQPVTPLLFAVEKNNKEIVKQLLQHPNIDIDKKWKKLTPLEYLEKKSSLTISPEGDQCKYVDLIKWHQKQQKILHSVFGKMVTPSTAQSDVLAVAKKLFQWYINQNLLTGHNHHNKPEAREVLKDLNTKKSLTLDEFENILKTNVESRQIFTNTKYKSTFTSVDKYGTFFAIQKYVKQQLKRQEAEKKESEAKTPKQNNP